MLSWAVDKTTAGMSGFPAPAPRRCLLCRAHPEQIRSEGKSLSGVAGCAVTTHLPLFGKRVGEAEGHLLLIVRMKHLPFEFGGELAACAH